MTPETAKSRDFSHREEAACESGQRGRAEMLHFRLYNFWDFTGRDIQSGIMDVSNRRKRVWALACGIRRRENGDCVQWARTTDPVGHQDRSGHVSVTRFEKWGADVTFFNP